MMAFPLQWLLGWYGLAFIPAVVYAWFALLLTGQWPPWLYNHCVRFLRFWARVNAYSALGTDKFPPLHGRPVPRTSPRGSTAGSIQSVGDGSPGGLRSSCGFAGILMLAFANLAGLVSWFVILATGRQPRSLFDAIHRGLAYWIRSYALSCLITQTCPPTES